MREECSEDKHPSKAESKQAKAPYKYILVSKYDDLGTISIIKAKWL